jgi:GPH family glycoside/pentoside/hexuronide:cation symporter
VPGAVTPPPDPAPTEGPHTHPSPPAHLPRRLVAAYGSGQAAEGIANYLLTALLLFYYTSILGLAGNLAGLALLVGLVFDAVTDPLIAVASDRTHSRWGRRHPYLLASALPLGLCLVMAFRPPGFVEGQTALFFWLLAMVVAIRAAMTLFHVPHMALGAELSQDYDERTRVVTARSVGSMIGTGAIITLYFVLLAENESPNYPDVRLNPLPYELHSLIAGVAAAAVILISTLGTVRALPWLRAPSADDRPRSLVNRTLRDMIAVLRIRDFRILVLGFTLCSLSWGFSSAMQNHLALYFWRVSIELQGIAGASIMLGILLGMGFWRRVALRLDKKPAFVLGMAWYTFFAAVTPLLKVSGLFPAEGSPIYTLVYAGASFLMAFGVASILVLSGSMMADITDEDELGSGLRREGIFFGAHSFATKVANGVGAALGGILYDFTGLTQGVAPADAPANAGTVLGLATGLLIAVMVGTGTWTFRRYDLDRARHAAIRSALDDRDSAVPPTTPA